MARITIHDLPDDMTFTRAEMRSISGGAVFTASSLSISALSSGGMTAAFPDVCKTPSPAGPIPIPYPNIASSADTPAGSKTVKTDGSPVSLTGDTFSVSTGDESGTV